MTSTLSAAEWLGIADRLDVLADSVAHTDVTGVDPAVVRRAAEALATEPDLVDVRHARVLLPHLDRPEYDEPTRRAVRRALGVVATRVAEDITYDGTAFGDALQAGQPGQGRDEPLRAVSRAIRERLDTHPVWVAALAASAATTVYNVPTLVQRGGSGYAMIVTQRPEELDLPEFTGAEAALRRGTTLPPSRALFLLAEIGALSFPGDTTSRDALVEIAEAMPAFNPAERVALIEALTDSQKRVSEILVEHAARLVTSYIARLPPPQRAERPGRADRRELIGLVKDIVAGDSPMGLSAPVAGPEAGFEWRASLTDNTTFLMTLCLDNLARPEPPPAMLVVSLVGELTSSLPPPPTAPFEWAVARALLQYGDDGGFPLAKARMLRTMAEPHRWQHRLEPWSDFLDEARRQSLPRPFRQLRSGADVTGEARGWQVPGARRTDRASNEPGRRPPSS